jgi:hypothetical protein
MAFQHKQSFFAFLQTQAASSTLEEAAPAENYLLDERLPVSREDDFLAFNGFSSVAPFTRDTWFKQHTDYGIARVAKPAVSTTFEQQNRPNWLSSLTPDWDVVRLETLTGLCERAPASGVDETEAFALISEMLDSRQSGAVMDPFREARLEKWLQAVNSGSDQRPAFVTPFVEAEEILRQPDWAVRLRDALGLGHIYPKNGRPMPIVLLQYSLDRVYQAHLGKPAWAASPTVLDDVSRTPNPCFFPSPCNASGDGFGFTVDFDQGNPTYRREFLHGHIPYSLDDFRRVGEVATDILPGRIKAARARHLDLLKSDLRHYADLPVRP